MGLARVNAAPDEVMNKTSQGPIKLDDQKLQVLTTILDIMARWPNLKGVSHQQFVKIVGLVGLLLFGLVLMVGGFSLLLGAATQLISGLMMKLGLSLLPALMMGFSVVGGLSISVGIFFFRKSAQYLRGQVPC